MQQHAIWATDSMDIESQQLEQACICRQRLVLMLTTVVVQLVYYYNLLFLTPNAPIPFHTSILTGKAWVLELMNGHPDRI